MRLLRAVRGGGGTALPAEARERTGVTVVREHLAAYTRICGFRLGDTLPVTYPHVLAFPLALDLMTAPGFPLPLVGLVHIANRITQRAPVTADQIMQFTVRTQDLRPHPRGRQFDVVATAAVDGAVVWTGLSTYLRKEIAASTHRDPPPALPTSAVWQVPARVGRDYAAVSGDRNPIHTSRLAARAFGFARPIAHGMWSLARCLSALEGRLPDAVEVRARFQRPLLLPGRVTFGAVDRGDHWEFGLPGHLAGQVTRS